VLLTRILPFALITIGVVAIALLMKLQKKEEKPEVVTPPVNVNVMTVETVPELPDTIRLPAVVEANRVVSVAAEVAGRVEQIAREEGTIVKAGELLVRLNADLLRAEYDRAVAQADYDKLEYDRKKSLVEGGAAPSRDLDEAASKLAIGKAMTAEAKARLDRAVINAPISGTLNKVPVEVGEYMQPGDPVAEIVDLSVAKVVVEVPELDAIYFRRGGRATVILANGETDRKMDGEITYLSAVADPLTRTARMEITVPNEDGLLRSGQIVNVELTRKVLKDAIMVPLMAVIPTEEGKMVYIVNSGEAKPRDVTLGLMRGLSVQITSGLGPGDRLIVAGHRFVGPGQKINVVEDAE
jgi:membrane fusion protein (multidrug efflux system)